MNQVHPQGTKRVTVKITQLHLGRVKAEFPDGTVVFIPGLPKKDSN